jgi:hypothetical protein
MSVKRQDSVSWQDRLDDASNVHDVVEIARDFLATWDRYEIAALPEPCRPGKIFDANDINAYAFALLRHDCDSEGGGAAQLLMQKMASFFSNASVRLSEILGGVAPLAEDDSRAST